MVASETEVGVALSGDSAVAVGGVRAVLDLVGVANSAAPSHSGGSGLGVGV